MGLLRPADRSHVQASPVMTRSRSARAIREPVEIYIHCGCARHQAPPDTCAPQQLRSDERPARDNNVVAARALMPYGVRMIPSVHRKQRKPSELSFVCVLVADGACRDHPFHSLPSDRDC